MKTWYITHGRGGFKAVLSNVPWWALAGSWATERLDVLLGHALCGEGTPNWLWRIPTGRPVYDEPDETGERWLANSVAGMLMNLFGCGLPLSDRHATAQHEVPVLPFQAAAIHPEWVADIIRANTETSSASD